MPTQFQNSLPSSGCANQLQNTLFLLDYLLGNRLRVPNVPIVSNVPFGTMAVANQLPIVYNLANELALLNGPTINRVPVNNVVNYGNLAGMPIVNDLPITNVPIANNLPIANMPIINNGLNGIVNLPANQNALAVVPNSNNYRIRKRTYLVNNELLQNRVSNVPLNNLQLNYQAANLPIANNVVQLSNIASPARLPLNYQNEYAVNVPIINQPTFNVRNLPINGYSSLPINNQITKLPVASSGCTCSQQMPVANNLRYDVPVVPFNSIANLPVVNGMPVIRVSEKVYRVNV